MARPLKSYLVTYDVSCPRALAPRPSTAAGLRRLDAALRVPLPPRPPGRRRMEQELRELIEVGEDRLLIAKLDEPAQSGRTAGRAQIP